MSPQPPAFAPPVVADYTSALQPPKPGAQPVQSAFRFSRAADGKTRVDSGNMSVISNPAAGQTMVLDHLKKTATIHAAPPPMPQAPGMPQMPQGLPGMPATPSMPNTQFQDLGKSVFKGHEVEGKRYVIQPPPPPPMPAMPKVPQLPGMPKAPQMPAMPKLPQLPGMPKAPQMPATPQAPGAPAPPAPPTPPVAPQPPPMPTTVESWTSPSLHLPMATRMNGSFGQLTQMCHTAVPGEPHPSAFQIPPGYKLITPQPPKLPTLPKPPAMPSLPKL